MSVSDTKSASVAEELIGAWDHGILDRRLRHRLSLQQCSDQQPAAVGVLGSESSSEAGGAHRANFKTMRISAIILSVIAAAVLAAGVLTRSGSSGHANTNPVALALARAERYWHGVPCRGQVQVASSAKLPAKVVDLAINKQVAAGKKALLAWTDFDTPLGLNRVGPSPTLYSDCTITLNATLWHSWQSDDGDFQWLCDVMTHELGHLFGSDDEGQTDPASIEYPFIEPRAPNFDAVPECRHVTLWYRGRTITG